MFTITEANNKIKIYHKDLILELTKEEADQLIVELQSFRKNLKWQVFIDYNTGAEAND